jgi:hypothetical protein
MITVALLDGCRHSLRVEDIISITEVKDNSSKHKTTITTINGITKGIASKDTFYELITVLEAIRINKCYS